MTEKLFYQNSHMQEFFAYVQSCEEKDGKYYVVLDRTAFFPEGGGMPGGGMSGGSRSGNMGGGP